MKLTVKVEGKTAGDLVVALEEATQWIDAGYLEGMNGCDESDYYFKISLSHKEKTERMTANR